MLMAGHKLFSNTLFTMRGEELLKNTTTPVLKLNGWEQTLLRNTLPSMIGEALLPVIATPPAPRTLSKMLPAITESDPMTARAELVKEKPLIAPRGPMGIAVSLSPAMTVLVGPAELCSVMSLPRKVSGPM